MGNLSAAFEQTPFRSLEPGRRYFVAAGFRDHDGAWFEPGRVLAFPGWNFVPYDDGLTLYFRDDGETVTIRLQDRPEAEAAVVDALDVHFIGGSFP